MSPEAMINDKVTLISSPPGLGRRVSDPSETRGGIWNWKIWTLHHLPISSISFWFILTSSSSMLVSKNIRRGSSLVSGVNRLPCQLSDEIFVIFLNFLPNFDLFSTFAARYLPSNLWFSWLTIASLNKDNVEIILKYSPAVPVMILLQTGYLHHHHLR